MWKLIQDEQDHRSSAAAPATSISCRSEGVSPAQRLLIFPRCERSRRPARRSLPKASSMSTRRSKPDLHFNSISGGTDINGCFAAGSPILPVYAGELQGPAPGMKIKAYDEKGKPVSDSRESWSAKLPLHPCRSISGTTRTARSTTSLL